MPNPDSHAIVFINPNDLNKSVKLMYALYKKVKISNRSNRSLKYTVNPDDLVVKGTHTVWAAYGTDNCRDLMQKYKELGDQEKPSVVHLMSPSVVHLIEKIDQSDSFSAEIIVSISAEEESAEKESDWNFSPRGLPYKTYTHSRGDVPFISKEVRERIYELTNMDSQEYISLSILENDHPLDSVEHQLRSAIHKCCEFADPNYMMGSVMTSFGMRQNDGVDYISKLPRKLIEILLIVCEPSDESSSRDVNLSVGDTSCGNEACGCCEEDDCELSECKGECTTEGIVWICDQCRVVKSINFDDYKDLRDALLKTQKKS